jgi:hypothetical protein
MARIKVPEGTGEVTHFDGDKRATYKEVNGEMVVDDAHVAAVLLNVPGSELMQEAPAKKEK